MANYNIHVDNQMEARTLWDLLLMEGECYDGMHCLYTGKTCPCMVTDIDIIGDQGYPVRVKACESASVKATYLAMMKDSSLLADRFPLFYKRHAFRAEISAVIGWLTRWDPNGDWDERDCILTPYQTIETLENLKEQLEDNYEDVPGWVDKAIEYLMVLAG